MFREGRPEMPQVEQTESKEKLRGAFADAVFKWVAALEMRNQKSSESNASKLNLSERIGAAAVPSIFFALLTGCGYKLDPQECQADEQAYIDKTIQWGEDHSSEIQQQMDVLWGDKATVSAVQVIDVLSTARVACGSPVAGQEHSLEEGGEAHFLVDDIGEEVIIVNVEQDDFKENLEVFLRGEHTADWSLKFLKSIETYDFGDQKVADVLDYDRAIAANIDILVHEAAHIATGLEHSAEAKQKLEAFGNEDATHEELAQVDQINAWGTAAQFAARQWGLAREDAILLSSADEGER